MQINTYLFFNGQCKAAFKTYERILGGRIVAMLTAGESPMAKEIPPERHGQILHARLVAGNQVLMGSDAPPEHFDQPQGFRVSVLVDSPEEAKRVFDALAENGKIVMPLEETFWAHRFGMLVDQFGTPWMINCEKAK